jgi:protein SCO1/2
LSRPGERANVSGVSAVDEPLAASGPRGASLDRRRRARPALLGVALACACVVGVAGVALARARGHGRDPGALQTLGEIPAFSMLDQRGATVTSDALRGQVLIVDFFYATCPTSCPRLSAQMAAFQERLRTQGPDLPVHLVSITLDPENDTPEVLAAYARKYHADDARWSFLSGRSGELDRVVVKGFKVMFERTDPAAGLGSIMHGEWFVLVDRRGHVRGYYQIGDEARMTELFRDAERLAREEAT